MLRVLKESVPTKMLPEVKVILAVAAGKGGVGKSTVAVNLALSLNEKGYKVGLLDADVYGPSLEQMLPEGMEPAEDLEHPEKLLPALTFGISFISVAHFKKEASIVRAPIANQIIEQFLQAVEWGPLDFLIVDFPPGTGDIQLTLMQKAPISGAIMVTTPQIVSTLDVRKAIQLFQRTEIPVLGVVENMSYFIHPATQEVLTPFGAGGGEALAKEFSLSLLGKIPLDPAVSRAGDQSTSLFEEDPESQVVCAFKAISTQVQNKVKDLPRDDFLIRQEDSQHLEIKIDGEWRSLSIEKLQKHCRCARCKGGGKSKEMVSLLEFSFVGRYAIKATFSSGCNQGIYPFSLLEALMK